jgi:hypothetical protein
MNRPPITHTKRRVNALSLSKMLAAMQSGPHSFNELAEETGLYYHTVRHYVKAMHVEGVCHIGGWLPDARGREVIAQFELGAGRDVKPHRVTSAQRGKAYRARLKQRELTAAICA